MRVDYIRTVIVREGSMLVVFGSLFSCCAVQYTVPHALQFVRIYSATAAVM